MAAMCRVMRSATLEKGKGGSRRETLVSLFGVHSRSDDGECAGAWLPSLSLYPSSSYHLAPLRDLVLHERGVLLGRVADRIGAKTFQLLLDVRRIDCAHHLGVQLVDDRPRRLGGRRDAEERSHFVAWYAA